MGNYESVHVGATADVPAGLDPADALEKVKMFVAAELVKAKKGRSEVRPVEQRTGSFRDIVKAQERQ